jgi:hypothetical protein
MLRRFLGHPNNLTKQHVNDLSVSRLNTYVFNFPLNTRDLLNSRGKELREKCVLGLEKPKH